MPVCLIVEGDGDKEAVPALFRRVARENGFYALTHRNQLQAGGLSKVRRAGNLERFLRYAAGNDASPVLVALDCEDDCPAAIAAEFRRRAAALGGAGVEHVEICLIDREYETFFLYCIESLRMAYPAIPWNDAAIANLRRPESIRNAKAHLARMMGRSYRETRDQTRFTMAIDLEVLRQRSRAFRHFESAVRRLAKIEQCS